MGITRRSELRKAAEAIDEYNYPDYQVLGIRIMNEGYRGYSYKPGRIAPRSWTWVDGNHTSERLPGTCALSLDYCRAGQRSTLEDIGGYMGRRIWILGSNDRVRGGEDLGEIIMENAVILAVIDLPDAE